MTTSLADELAAGSGPRASILAVRLADRDGTAGFIGGQGLLGEGAVVETRQDLRRDALEETRGTRVVLLTTSVLLALVTVASVAVLVAGRMSAHTRQVGTLKAVGMTPAQVAAVLLMEHLALAALATAVGAVAGSRLADVVAAPATNLLDVAGSAAPTWSGTGQWPRPRP